MKRLTFWFDVISRYAYLAFERLPEALAGLPVAISYRPLLFAGLLNQWGQKGPAEIEPKRAWTFRHVAWLAHRYGVTLQTPAQHPFNPLALLRLATACAPMGELPGRSVCEAVVRHVWQGGSDANDPAQLASLAERLAPLRDPQSDEVKQALRENTGRAIGKGVFGVPTFEVVFAPHRRLRAVVMPAGRGMGAPQPAAGAAEPGRPATPTHVATDCAPRSRDVWSAPAHQSSANRSKSESAVSRSAR